MSSSHFIILFVFNLFPCIAGKKLITNSLLSQLRFIEIVQYLHATASPQMNPPLFIFQLSAAAAGYNAKVLTEHNFDLNRIIEQQHPSQISYGSEFRDPKLLEDLLCDHPFWSHLKNIL